MWKMWERGKKEYRKNVIAAVNINKWGMFLNRRACELVGIGEGDTRWLLFFEDETNPNKYGFRVLLNEQEYPKSIYKVSYRDTNKTAKINAKSFVREHNLIERAEKVETNSFHLVKEDEEDFYSFIIQ
jgi:hypothetical protein